MSDCGEQESLLHKELKDRGGSRSQGSVNRTKNRPYARDLSYLDEEIWTDSDSSSCSSYYSGCHSRLVLILGYITIVILFTVIQLLKFKAGIDNN